MKTILAILGVLAMLVGLLWVGQGLGVIKWPASSFMIAQTAWIWRGALLAGLGALLLARARRRPR